MFCFVLRVSRQGSRPPGRCCHSHRQYANGQKEGSSHEATELMSREQSTAIRYVRFHFYHAQTRYKSERRFAHSAPSDRASRTHRTHSPVAATRERPSGCVAIAQVDLRSCLVGYGTKLTVLKHRVYRHNACEALTPSLLRTLQRTTGTSFPRFASASAECAAYCPL